MQLSNLRVAPKLWLTILGLLVVMTLSNVGVQHITRSTLEDSRTDVQRIEQKIALAQYMRGHILRSLEASTAQMASNEMRLQDAFYERFEGYQKDVEQAMARMQEVLTSEEEKERFTAMVEALESIQGMRVMAESMMDIDDHNARADFAFGEYTKMTSSYIAEVQSFIALQNAQLQALTDESDARIARSVWLGQAVTAVVLALGVALTYWLVGGIVRPLSQAVQMAQAIGEGDLRVHQRSTRRDEFGSLIEALNQMTERLRRVVQDVRSGVGQVSVAASEVANGSRDLSARTEHTAANLQQTTASIEHMSSSIAQASEHMHQTNQLALSAVQAAERGGDVVAQVVMSMDAIHTSSRKISDIIGVIDGIAFQTNILALNAAVEAARAGEQGRGFAVVAAEVRSLAGRSAEAAKEIKALISASVGSVNTGAEQVSLAGETMQEIVSSVRRVTDLVAEVAEVATAQSTGFSQVNQAVTQLDHMTQQNAALVEQTSAAAAAMHEQSQRLAQVVAVFQTGQGSTPAAHAPVAHQVASAPLLTA